jgi:site-specific DNA recombinase
MSARPAVKAIRCAIYTRKSSEEGLDQAFNSLHAQREACEAYVLSQAGEGWMPLAQQYDDGGFSGGTMERPALKRLLADIGAGKVDTVVVYKIDRLTRSLADFAKIVEQLDGAGASFVSVTQAFNTTTSMGRLTLNVLLSFAQFEREVTGERIRDKIAASKAKGMWMGGYLALGYDTPTDLATRSLVVNPAEAETVRLIFARYLELGSVNLLERWLHDQQIRSKAWISTRGRAMGGLRFSRGALFHLLKSRVYVGEITHKDVSHPNAHPPIIERATFDAVQALLAARATAPRERKSKAGHAALKGLIFDGEGRPMSPTFSYGRAGRAYRYYVSSPLQKGGAVQDDDTLRRVPGQSADDLVEDAISRLVRGPAPKGEIGRYLARVELHAQSVHLVIKRRALFIGDREAAVDAEALTRWLAPGERLAIETSDPSLIRVILPVRLKTRGGRSWLALPDGQAPASQSRVDAVLLGGLSKAHGIIAEAGIRTDGRPVEGLAPASPAGAYQRRLASLAFLSPDIQAAIASGRQPAGLKLEYLLRGTLPLAWADQKAKFGF